MAWPDLALLIITYQRKATLLATIRKLYHHIHYTGHWHVIVADDGSADGTQDALRTEYPDATLIQSDRAGLGANTNAGLRAALGVADYVLQLQDDMQPTATIDLHPHVQLLQSDPTAGFVRLWGVGGHAYEGRLEGNYWRIFWHCPELYIPSDRPHIKHRRFHEHYGMYPEGLPTSTTEDAWCHQCKNRAGMEGRQLDVFVPQNQLTETTWEHVGWDQRWRDVGL